MDHHSQSWVVKMALFYSYCYHSIQTIIYTMTYHIISYYIILYHIISYYIILYPLILQPSPVNIYIYICIYIYMEVPWNRATPQLSIYRCYFPWHIHHPMLATPVLRTASWSSGCWFVSLLGGMLCLASQGILDRERNPEMDGFHLVNLISGSPLVKLC